MSMVQPRNSIETGLDAADGGKRAKQRDFDLYNIAKPGETYTG